MDKKTVLAVILLSVLFTAFLAVGPKNHPQGESAAQPSAPAAVGQSDNFEPGTASLPEIVLSEAETASVEKYVAETDLYRIEFSTYGASITSLQLKNYTDGDVPVEMIQKGADADWGAFLMYFDKDNQGKPFYGPFTYQDKGNGQFVFEAAASVLSDGVNVPFTITKTYTFVPGEYLFEVKVALAQPQGQYLPLNFSGFSYTLETGPQIGPSFVKLDNQQVYRKPVYFNGRKSKVLRLGSKPVDLDDRVIWAGIDGKYFALIGVPDENMYRQIWSSKAVKSIDKNDFQEGTQLSFVRSLIRSSRQEDRFFFYMGPKQTKQLQRYNSAAQNSFDLANIKMEQIAPGMPVFGWLESVFKIVLEFIYRFVPNWGWAIVILTILVKLILFPLTLKSLLSTAKLTDLQPKIKALQEKYKDDPAGMQKAQFELYQKEGINPMAGCLPLLLQLPIFIALYNLFNKFFELRGARFFGWITDLSAPDVVMQFSGPLPILGWTGLHLLPIVYLLSQFLMNKVMQSDANSQTSQMRTIMWIMPLMFFFIFYQVASALLVYWIMSNILSIFQQLLISYLKRKGHFRNDEGSRSIKNRKKYSVV